MPYEGEYAGYRSLQRLADTERIRTLLGRSRALTADATTPAPVPDAAPAPPTELPDFVVAIDGSNAQVPVRTGYPGSEVGYCTVASVLLNLGQIDRLDAQRPVDPVAFRKTEQTSTIDAALPGANVVSRSHTSARDSFREALYEVLQDVVVDDDDRTPLIATYESLFALKPTTRPQECPHAADGCINSVLPTAGLSTCPCPARKALYSTDALRIHEGFRDAGSNGEAFGEVRQVWEAGTARASTAMPRAARLARTGGQTRLPLGRRLGGVRPSGVAQCCH